MLIFLDFDGVTHPYFSRSDFNDGKVKITPFAFLPHIESVIREFDNAKIVISSTWRLHHTMDELRLLFAEDMRERVIGVTPEIKLNSHGNWEGCRQLEVEQYLAENFLLDITWVAIDDVKENYRPEANLVWCLDKFDAEEASQLRAILINMSSKPCSKMI